MDNKLGMMQVSQALNELFEKVLGNIFLQLPSLPHISQQVASRAQLHHKANVLACFKLIIQSHHTRVVTLL